MITADDVTRALEKKGPFQEWLQEMRNETVGYAGLSQVCPLHTYLEKTCNTTGSRLFVDYYGITLPNEVIVEVPEWVQHFTCAIDAYAKRKGTRTITGEEALLVLEEEA